jgi:hypothetical protein
MNVHHGPAALPTRNKHIEYFFSQTINSYCSTINEFRLDSMEYNSLMILGNQGKHVL